MLTGQNDEYKYSGLMSIYFKEKSERFEKAMDSILKQEVLPLEFILVEDGPLTQSLYESIDKIKKIFELHNINFIIVENETNQGLGRALNNGMKKANCNLIARFDSDDINRPDRMSKTLDRFRSNQNLVLIGSNILEFDPNNSDFVQYRKVPIGKKNIVKKISSRNPFNHMTVTFKKNAVEGVGGYEDVPYFEDYYLWFRLLKKGYNIDNIDETLVDACVDSNFYTRRSGVQYLFKEINFQTLIFKKRYISFFKYLYNLIVRGGSRLIPHDAMKYVYLIIRRHENTFN
ncbi:glycosyltransferase [Pediococcus pentosaceus]|uniref:glycosyltransferase n=1 Tax=Pediococcus pentosaceus TaxID=1255 RepID=UPI0013220110|nr:glycosyltransferase [Pediococcus pentosaceus]KAF0522879.1 glycosyltransferase [Pediococcus pentosaceus]MCQ0028979.1 glycosyltransferase [Pediococcus pentosaceus]MDD1388078.1 glycosyltransferase [Pediococcus pentosaceus]